MKTLDGSISEKFLKCSENTVILQRSRARTRVKRENKEGGGLQGDRIERGG